MGAIVGAVQTAGAVGAQNKDRVERAFGQIQWEVVINCRESNIVPGALDHVGKDVKICHLCFLAPCATASIAAPHSEGSCQDQAPSRLCHVQVT